MTLPAFGFDDAAYAFGQPVMVAEFKTRPDDFIVEEILGFEPGGEGEHLFLLLQTDDQNTRFTLQILSRLFGVSQKLISYSGLKDRRGHTSQWFSIHLPGKNVEVNAEQLQEKGIKLLRFSRHNKKLRIGTHKANRFHITLRNVTGADTLESRIEQITRNGVPNYFGPQRFGHHGNNVGQALHWVAKNELPYEREVRSRVLSTLRSWLFNGQLSRRIQDGSWQRWQMGDPVVLDGSHSFFHPDAWDATLQQRYSEGDIHLGGWLWSVEHNGNSTVEINRYLEAAQLSADVRPLRLLPQQFESELHGTTLQLSFNLPAGAYATSVLRELVQLVDLSLPEAG